MHTIMITITKGKYRSLFVCNPVANLGLKLLLLRITWHYFVSSLAIYTFVCYNMFVVTVLQARVQIAPIN